MGVYSTIWDYPGRTLAATLTSTLSNSLINEFSFSWGSTSPSKYFGQRNCDYCPGGTDAFQYPTTQSVGINYPYLFPGTKLDPDKIPNVSMTGLHRDQQRRVSGIVERLRVPVGRQRHQDHRQPRVQGRPQHRAIGDERSHSTQLRAGAGDDEPERLVPLHGRARRGHRRVSASPMPCSACSTTTRSSATSRTRSGWRWPTTSTRRTVGSRPRSSHSNSACAIHCGSRGA